MRLPNGVFAPYTGIPTNLLFFERSGPTREIWIYEQPLPAGRKSYSKTQSIQVEEFAPLQAWWNERVENEQAWRVPVGDVLKYDDKGNLLSVNLDLKNPSVGEDFEHLPPERLVEDIIKKEQRIIEIMTAVSSLLTGEKE